MMDIFFWFAFAFIVGAWANRKGRNAYRWFFLSVIVTPILSGLLLAAVGDKPKETSTDGTETKPCPYCAEVIKQAAIVCKHCNKELPAALTRQPASKDTLIRQIY